jgi:hypothetical protein
MACFTASQRAASTDHHQASLCGRSASQAAARAVFSSAAHCILRTIWKPTPPKRSCYPEWDRALKPPRPSESQALGERWCLLAACVRECHALSTQSSRHHTTPYSPGKLGTSTLPCRTTQHHPALPAKLTPVGWLAARASQPSVPPAEPRSPVVQAGAEPFVSP